MRCFCHVFHNHSIEDPFRGCENGHPQAIKPVIPQQALLHKILSEFYAIEGSVKRTYGSWSVTIGWLGMYVLSTREVSIEKSLFPFLLTLYGKDIKGGAQCSFRFWYQDQVSINLIALKVTPLKRRSRMMTWSPWGLLLSGGLPPKISAPVTYYCWSLSPISFLLSITL